MVSRLLLKNLRQSHFEKLKTGILGMSDLNSAYNNAQNADRRKSFINKHLDAADRAGKFINYIDTEIGEQFTVYSSWMIFELGAQLFQGDGVRKF